MNDTSGAATAASPFAPLSSEQHRSLRIARDRGYRFARAWNAVPVVLPELIEAATIYPVVFTAGATPMLVAVVGAEKEHNAFVDEAGQWASGVYVPAVARQQPFGLVKSPAGGDEFVVVIEEGHELVSDSEGDPIFDDGALSKQTEEYVALCREMQPATVATQEYVKAVIAAGLLAAKAAPFTRPNGERGFVQGLSMIDGARLRELPDATVLDWHRRGWLAASYLHLASERRWLSLFERAGLRGVPADGR